MFSYSQEVYFSAKPSDLPAFLRKIKCFCLLRKMS